MPLPIKIEVRRREEEEEVPRADICFRISAVGNPTFNFVAGEQYLKWNGNETKPGGSVEIPVGTRIYPSVRIKNTGGVGADCRIRVDNVDTEENVFYAIEYIAKNGELNYKNAGYFVMPAHAIEVTIRACYNDGTVDCIHDNTATFTLNVAKEPKACFLAVDEYFDNVPSSLEILIGDEVRIGSGCMNCGEAEGNIHTTSYVDGALCADAFKSLPVGTANDIARDPDTYSVKASCATFDMPNHAVKVDRYGEHWDGSKWVEDFHISFMLTPTTVAELRPKGFIYSYFPNSNDEKAIGTSVDVSFSVLNDSKVRGRIKGIVKKNGDDFITLEETIDTGTENKISTTKSFIMPDVNVTLDYSVQHYDDETEMWVTDLTHYVITLSPEEEIEPPQVSDRILPDPRWIVREDITKLYIPFHAHSLKSDKHYYARILCGTREVAHLELIEFGRLKQFQDIYIDKATVDRWCTPLPFTIDMVLLEGSTEVDMIQRTISAIPVEMSKSEFITKIVGGIDTAALPSAPPAAGGWFSPTSSFAAYSGTCEGKTLMIGIMLNPFGGCTGNNPPTESDCILFNYNGINYDYGVDGSIPYECGLKALSELPTVKPSFDVTVTNTKPETCLLCHHNERFLLEWIPKEVCWRRITTDGQVETFTADDGLIPGDEYSFTCGHVMTGGCIQYPPISRLWETFEGEKKVNVVCPTVESPWSYLICRHFGVSDEECDAWILSWVLDPIFLAEEIMIVKEGKNLAGEPVEATKLDLALIAVATAGIVTPGFSEGMVLKQFKELIRLSKGSDEFALLLKTGDVAHFLSVASYAKIKTFTALCKGGKFDDAIKLVDNLPEVTTKNADWVFKRYDKWYELLGKGLGKTKATEVIVKHGISKKLKGVIVGSAALIAGLTFKQILVIWFCIDNLPFYIYMWLKWHGKGPGDVGYEANERINLVETDSWTVRRNLELEYYELARESIVLYEEHLESAKTYIDENEDTLKRSNDYDTSYGGYKTFALLLKTLKLEAGVITWPEVFQATVRHARDGDSFEIEYVIGEESRRIDVRIVGINTPEMTGKKGDIKCTTSPIIHVPTEYSDLAKNVITALEDETVTIQLDLSHVYDNYQRLLARVLSNGTDIGLEQLNKGLACYYFRETHKWVDDATYRAAEATAKDAETGIWSLPPPDTGNIRCESSPSTAEIWYGTAIGNEEKTVYTTDKTIEDIAVGDYIVTFKAPLKCKKDKERCALIQCSTRVTVLKDDTVPASCNLCAIYEIREPYYCKDRVCAEGIEKREMDAEIFIDGHRTDEWARGDRTIIKFGTDIDGNAFTLGTWHRECNIGKHTIELRREYHKTIKITKNFKSGDYYGDDMDYEMPEGKPEEEVVPTPTPVPGEPVPPVEGTGVLHVGHVFEKTPEGFVEQISTGRNPFTIWLKRAGDFECECHDYVPSDIVFGPGKFCDPKKEHRKCRAELGTYTLIIKYSGYERFEYPFTIEAGDNITVPTIYMKEQAAITSATDLTESLIPAEIYLNTAAQFTIKVKNTGEYPLQYKLNLGFSGVDTANEFAFHPDIEWSETVDAGGETMIPVSVTLPSEALPIEKEEATYDIKTLLEAKVM